MALKNLLIAVVLPRNAVRDTSSIQEYVMSIGRSSPKPGEPEPNTKVWNEKTYFWCSKCIQWNLNHVTGSHRSREKAPASANVTTEDDDASLSTVGGSTNFASYDMRNLSLGHNPSAYFAGALRSGLRCSCR